MMQNHILHTNEEHLTAVLPASIVELTKRTRVIHRTVSRDSVRRKNTETCVKTAPLPLQHKHLNSTALSAY